MFKYCLVGQQPSTKTNGWISWTSEPAQNRRGHFFFYKKKINCMIKITYKCKVLPLKLDCMFWNSLILTNLKGIHCYSTFWHTSVSIWQGYDKNQWKVENIDRNQAAAHAWWWWLWWRWGWWWCLKWQVGMSTESHPLQLVYAKDNQCFPQYKILKPFHVALISANNTAILVWVNLINSTHGQVSLSKTAVQFCSGPCALTSLEGVGEKLFPPVWIIKG